MFDLAAVLGFDRPAATTVPVTLLVLGRDRAEFAIAVDSAEEGVDSIARPDRPGPAGRHRRGVAADGRIVLDADGLLDDPGFDLGGAGGNPQGQGRKAGLGGSARENRGSVGRAAVWSNRHDPQPCPEGIHR